jgi:hypothetical protein
MMARKSPYVRKVFDGLLRRELGGSQNTNLWLAKIAWSLGRMDMASSIYEKTAAETGASLSNVAAIQKNLGDSIISGSIYKQLSAAIDALALPSPASDSLILAPVSTRYFDMFEMWLQQTKRHTHGHLVVLALDSDSTLRLKEEFGASVIDLSSFFAFHQGGVIDVFSRSNLWILRVMILHELVKRGHTITSLDLDAILVDDLAPLLASLPPTDVVAQIDYSIPVDVARKLGFILCCGFMVIRSNPATIAMLEQYQRQTINELDDQLALNHLLAEQGVQDVKRTDRSMQFRAAGVSWVCPDKSLVSRDITYGTVIRHFQQEGQTIDQLKTALGIA